MYVCVYGVNARSISAYGESALGINYIIGGHLLKQNSAISVIMVAHLLVFSYINQCGKGGDRSSHIERPVAAANALLGLSFSDPFHRYSSSTRGYICACAVNLMTAKS